MNLLADIKELMKEDKEHNVKVEVNCLGIKILLDYDPENNYEERVIIPIEYSTLEEFAYIPDTDYREMFNVNDYGIIVEEIDLISKIMHYLESHNKEIKELCDSYSWELRNGDV